MAIKKICNLFVKIFLFIIGFFFFACSFSSDETKEDEFKITVQPKNAFAITGFSHTFSLEAVSPDKSKILYQWYYIEEIDSHNGLIYSTKGDIHSRESNVPYFGGLISSTAGNVRSFYEAIYSPDFENAKKIENATQADYEFTPQTEGKYAFFCVVTNIIEENESEIIKSEQKISDLAYLTAIDQKNISSEVQFLIQPKKMNLAHLNESITLNCTLEKGQDATFQWYESLDGTTNSGSAVKGAVTENFISPVFSKKGIRYFFCVATVDSLGKIDESDEKSCKIAISSVSSVACTGLPTVFINTPQKESITSKSVWLENATISIKGSSNKSWNFDAVTTNIRGRGNTTWGQVKKPYALKLEKKQKILGMPKHKRWVLIANYLDSSFLRNELAFYLSEQFDLDYTVHGKFVDLVLNDEYKGLYYLGEAIKVGENRININDGKESITNEEDKDYLIEMDVYYDETVKFKSAVRNLPYMIKNDDFMVDENNTITSGGKARLNRLEQKISQLESFLYPDFTTGMNTNSCCTPDEQYAKIIDIDSWIKFYFVNEIMDNGELGHPKSCYFTFESEKNIFKAGPVWDFDWASLGTQNSCRLQNTIYYNALFKSPVFKSHTKELWNKIFPTLNVDSKIESIRTELSVAAKYDLELWGPHKNPDEIIHSDFDKDVDILKERLNNKIRVVNEAMQEN